MKLITFFLFPFFCFGQITHLKSVTADINNSQYELICVTFYRGGKVGFDLATHRGDFIGKCEVKAIKPSGCTIDSSAVPRIIRAFNEREKRRRNAKEGQEITGWVSVLLIKSIADSKFNWK